MTAIDPFEDAAARHDAALAELVDDVYLGLVRAVATRAALARQIAQEQGVAPEQWTAMPFAEREALLNRASVRRRRSHHPRRTP